MADESSSSSSVPGALPEKSIQQKLDEWNQAYIDKLERDDQTGSVRIKARILAAVFDSIADGLIVFDQDQTVVMANLAGARMAGVNLDGITRPELRDRFEFFFDHGLTRMPPESEPLIVAMSEKKPTQLEGYIRGRSLPEGGRWFRAHAAPILNDDVVTGGVTVFQDITERLRVEDHRNCLSALISHDMKNHLSAEITFLDLLLQQLPETLNPRLLKLIDELKKTNLRFLQISNSLLEMSRARLFGPEYRQSADLVEIVRHVVELNRLCAAERNISINVHTDENAVLVQSIPAVLHQVLHNILQNAIEASRDGEQIDIYFDKTERFVSCDIVDHGPGMTPEQVARLFDPERVASHQPMTTNSTGFGLYLSAILLAELGGKIDCRSEVGKGTSMKMVMEACVEDDV